MLQYETRMLWIMNIVLLRRGTVCCMLHFVVCIKYCYVFVVCIKYCYVFCRVHKFLLCYPYVAIMFEWFQVSLVHYFEVSGFDERKRCRAAYRWSMAWRQ